MRDILFKAKRIDNGEWIKGYYFYNPNIEKSFIHNWLSGGLVEVQEDTLCQYTGLTDKNGNMIWENDVVKEDWGNYTGVVHFGLFENQVLKNMGFNIHWLVASSYRQDLPYWADKLEVKGNIFDNPELLLGV